MPNFTWSYSRLKNYETCPKRHFHYDVVKDVKDDDAGASEGIDAHKAYSARISKGTKLPMGLTQHEPILAKLEALPGEHYSEQKLALTSDFKPTSFFSNDVWFRTIIDFAAVMAPSAAVIDYKTGKPKSDTTQLALMSATVMHILPEIEKVKAALLFLNHNTAERAEYKRENLPRIWADILPRVHKLEAEEEYPPKPSGLCVRYCLVTQCPFHGRGTR